MCVPYSECARGLDSRDRGARRGHARLVSLIDWRVVGKMGRIRKRDERGYPRKRVNERVRAHLVAALEAGANKHGTTVGAELNRVLEEYYARKLEGSRASKEDSTSADVPEGLDPNRPGEPHAD